MAYSKKVVEKFENTLNNPEAFKVGRFDPKDADVGTGMVGAPACGDVMKLQIKCEAKGNTHIIKDVKFLANSIIDYKNIKEQKKRIKEIIFHEELTAASLFPILLIPDPENLNDLKYFPHKNINDKNFSNYISKYIA